MVVGAGTVRADDPALTVRGGRGAGRRPAAGSCSAQAPAGAKVQPALEWAGELGGVLDELGGEGVLQVLVEGGATVARAFHAPGLVDRYVLYLAPALFGGDDGRRLLRRARRGHASTTAWRGDRRRHGWARPPRRPRATPVDVTDQVPRSSAATRSTTRPDSAATEG